jgi:hypothetical protein
MRPEGVRPLDRVVTLQVLTHRTLQNLHGVAIGKLVLVDFAASLEQLHEIFINDKKKFRPLPIQRSEHLSAI